MAEPHPYHHGDLRNALLASARCQLEEHGFEHVSVAKAAAEAGVSVAAPYRHFADRAALLGELAAIGFAELTDAMDAVPADAGTRQRVVEAGLAYVRYADDHPQMFRLMFSHSGRGSAGPLGERALAALDALARAIAGEGRLALPHDVAVRIMWSTVHGLSMLRVGELPPLRDLAVEDHREDLELVLDGIMRP